MDTMTPIIIRALHGFDDAPDADAKIEALLDDFAREEREKAALRNCKRCMPCGYSQCPQEHNCPTRAAILTDEED